MNDRPQPQQDALVVFMPSGRRGRFPLGTPVLDAARSLGVYIESVCGGRGLCGRCQIEVSEGSFTKLGISSGRHNLSPFSQTEQRYAERRSLPEARRLSCSARVAGDLVVDVPSDAQINRQLVRKRAESRDIPRDPVTRLHYVEVEPPDMDRPSGDADRLAEALQREWDIADARCELHVLARLQKVLRDGDFKATAAVHNGAGDAPRIVALWPGFRDLAFGIACDIGSTTIALHLCDLLSGRTVASAGTANPQIRFGEDLMSRVSYVMMNRGGEHKLTEAVRAAVNALVGKVVDEAGISRDDVLEAVIVGNPVMHHLFLGIDPSELGGAPFALAVSNALSLAARDVGLAVNAGARLYVLPCIAGHVGADAAGAILAEGPQRDDGATLLVDIGTNAEIVLGNRQRVLAASSPTGPAFEGAEISHGQRAAPGAIERVRIDPVTLEPRIKVIGVDCWSNEPDFAEQAAIVGVTGICGSGIVEAVAEMFLAGVVTAEGVIDGARVLQSDRIVANGRTHAYVLWRGEVDLTVTQNDVRAIQLAKAALYAGVRLLMDELGVDAVDRIRLAGAFGSYIDPKYAMVLGLIPDCDVAAVAAVGNAAGTGARMALLNRGYRDEIEKLVRRIEKVETAMRPRFQEHFVAAMALPHKSDPFLRLRAAVALPEAGHGGGGGDEAGTGRRRSRRRASRS